MPPQHRRFFEDKNLPACRDISIEEIVQEYTLLSLTEAPSEAVANRIDEILTLAIANPALNERLLAVDEAICQQQGLLDEGLNKQYGNALAHLQEFVDLDSLKNSEAGKVWQTEVQRLRNRIDLLQR